MMGRIDVAADQQIAGAGAPIGDGEAIAGAPIRDGWDPTCHSVYTFFEGLSVRGSAS